MKNAKGFHQKKNSVAVKRLPKLPRTYRAEIDNHVVTYKNNFEYSFAKSGDK